MMMIARNRLLRGEKFRFFMDSLKKLSQVLVVISWEIRISPNLEIFYAIILSSMVRSRSRSQERKKSKRDKSPPPRQLVSRGKWDEGFGGSFLSATAQEALTNPALTLPTQGELPLRKLIVNGIPKNKNVRDIVDEFAEEILYATGNESAKGVVYPVVNCQFLTAVGATRNAMVEFRTPTAANVALTCLQNRRGLKVKRPKDFPPSEISEGVAEDQLKSVDLALLAGPAAAGGAAELAAGGGTQLSNSELTTGTTRLSVFGMPGNSFSEQNVKDLFSQFGKLRMVSFPKDHLTGLVKPGSTGHVDYEEFADAVMAETAMNGFPCGNSVVKVQRVENSRPGGPAVPPPRRAPPASTIPTSVTARILSNPSLAAQIKQGRDIGARPSLVVQLLNAVYAEDIAEDADYNDIVKEVKEEAGRYGPVESIRIPRPSAASPNPLGTGKIFIQFSDLTSARKFQQDTNGRQFDGRVVCAAFYPLDRYLQGKYVLYEK